MPIRGTELGTIAEIVPGAIQGGTTTSLARTGGNAPVPPDVDIEYGAVGATFIGGSGHIIDKWISGQHVGLGSVPVYTARTILSWEVLFLPGVTNSVKFDVWKTTYAAYDTVGPANSICGGDFPKVIGANKNNNISLGAWATSIDAGDILVFVCLCRASPRWAQVSLSCQETA